MIFCLLKYHNEDISIYLLIIFIICILFQYTNINYLIFNKLSFSLKYPLGRLIELTPPAIIGLYLYKYIKKIDIKKLFVLLMIFSIFIILGALLDYKFIINGFGYQGIGKLTGIFILLTIP